MVVQALKQGQYHCYLPPSQVYRRENPFGLGPEMELFHMPLERHHFELTNECTQNNSISNTNPEGMPCDRLTLGPCTLRFFFTVSHIVTYYHASMCWLATGATHA